MSSLIDQGLALIDLDLWRWRDPSSTSSFLGRLLLPIPPRLDAERRRGPSSVGDPFVVLGGGGGNRTRVRQRGTKTSPGAVCCGLSQPRRSRRRVAEPGSVTVGVASGPVTGPSASGPLVDASDRAEGEPGLTEFHTRSGGEGELGARCIGTYCFATMVDEIASPPRPASPGTTSDVETCHPRGCGLAAVLRATESFGPGAAVDPSRSRSHGDDPDGCGRLREVNDRPVRAVPVGRSRA
jgi:hypothetical protein